MEQQFLSILAEVLKTSNEDLLVRFDDKTIWDSMQRVEVIFALEDEFGVQFSEEELAESITPKRLCDTLFKKVG